MIELEKNYEIKFQKVLVVSDTGEKLGVMSPKDGIKLAFEKDLDLVCVSPSANPPVCKFMDYGKYKYSMIKKEKNNSQQVNKTSEIQLTYLIQENDMKVKANTCKRLLNDKSSSVRIVMRLRGREVSMTDLAIQKIKKFVEMCSDFSVVKKDISIDGRDIKVILGRK